MCLYYNVSRAGSPKKAPLEMLVIWLLKSSLEIENDNYCEIMGLADTIDDRFIDRILCPE